MKTITIQKTQGQTRLQQIALQIGGIVTIHENETHLKIDNASAKGTIHQFILKNGISYMDYDLVFYDDIVLSNATKDHRIYDFIYASESDIYHSFAGRDKQLLHTFQPSIFSSVPNMDSLYYFSKERKHRVSMIHVSANANGSKELTSLMQQLQSIFKAAENKHNFAYVGSFNLNIADNIQQLNGLTHKGIVRTLMTESIIKTILAMELQQHFDDVNNQNSKLNSLTNREMTRIREASLCIREQPEGDYTIASLSQRSGLSKTKLQEGFRTVYGFTVTNYIKHIRILMAEQLIKTTDLNISEIVYSIGLTSRSYFSKIFKETYNCSPKYYKEHQQLTARSA